MQFISLHQVLQRFSPLGFKIWLNSYFEPFKDYLYIKLTSDIDKWPVDVLVDDDYIQFTPDDGIRKNFSKLECMGYFSILPVDEMFIDKLVGETDRPAGKYFKDLRPRHFFRQDNDGKSQGDYAWETKPIPISWKKIFITNGTLSRIEEYFSMSPTELTYSLDKLEQIYVARLERGVGKQYGANYLNLSVCRVYNRLQISLIDAREKSQLKLIDEIIRECTLVATQFKTGDWEVQESVATYNGKIAFDRDHIARAVFERGFSGHLNKIIEEFVVVFMLMKTRNV